MKISLSDNRGWAIQWPKNMHSRGLKKISSPRGQTWLFFRNFLKHPNMLGWMIPSSRFLVEAMLRQVDWNKALVLVEYGPGVGTFTTEILRRMRPDATLIVFETNGEFVQFLRQWLADPRLYLLHRSAEEVDNAIHGLGFRSADYVISSIPFKTVPEAAGEIILRKTRSVLHPEGAFLLYQFSDALMPKLERVFSRVARDFTWLNFLPARLFCCMR